MDVAAAAPSQTAGALAVTLAQQLARERQAALRIVCRVVLQSKVDRVDSQLVCQLVECRLESEGAGRLSGSPIERRRPKIQLHQVLRRLDVRNVVQHPRLERRALDPIFERRCAGRDVLPDGGDRTVAARTEGHPLDRVRPRADRTEHLSAAEHDLHGAPIWRAPSAARSTCDQADPFDPNAPPVNLDTTRTWSSGIPSVFAAKRLTP